MSNGFRETLKWVARILGAFVVVLIVVFAVGEGVPNPLAQPPAVAASLAAMAAMLAGLLLLAWRWNAAGGLLAVAGFAVFTALNGFRVNAFLAPAFVAGVLHMIYWATSRRQARR